MNLVLAVIVVYLIAMLAIGFYSSRKIKGLADYIVAGRRLPLWLAAATLFATWFCGETAIGGAAMAYLFGLKGVLMDPIGASVCLFLSGIFFVRILRRLRYLTIVDFFERRYDTRMGVLASVVQVLAYIGWTGGLLLAFGRVFEALMGVPTMYGVIIATVVTIIYTFIGGMWSVTLTDFVQMLILAVGFIIMLPIAISAAGGWGAITAAVPGDFFSILPGPNWSYLGYVGLLGMMFYISTWVVQGLGSLSCQDLIQRSLSSKNEAVAVYASYTAGILYITVGLVPAILGIIGLVLLPGLEEPELVLPLMAQKLLPPIGVALFAAALIAAIMSSADSAILAPSSIIAQNLLPKVKPNITEKGKLLAAQISTVIIAVVSLLIALYAETIYYLVNFSWALMLVTLAVPFIAGIYWRRANAYGALIAVAVALVVWGIGIWMVLPATLVVEEGVMEWALWDAIYIADIPALIAAIVTIIAASLATQRVNPPKPLTDIDGAEVKVEKVTEYMGFISPAKCMEK